MPTSLPIDSTVTAIAFMFAVAIAILIKATTILNQVQTHQAAPAEAIQDLRSAIQDLRLTIVELRSDLPPHVGAVLDMNAVRTPASARGTRPATEPLVPAVT